MFAITILELYCLGRHIAFFMFEDYEEIRITLNYIMFVNSDLEFDQQFPDLQKRLYEYCAPYIIDIFHLSRFPWVCNDFEQ